MEDIPMTKKYIVDTIYNLNFAISKNLPYCYLGFDEEANNDIWVKKENWNKILEILIDSSIKLEEYELIKEITEIKNKI